MQTELSAEFKGTRDGDAAEAILRKCVHCGFCTATCPTYQLLGDELDGPRGRIYLIKQVLEGATPTRSTQLHLDRCLTCRNCETTCPSGVEYGHLVDIGRKLVDQRVARPPAERAVRWLLKEGLTSPLFAPAMKMGQMVRPLLPAALKDKVPAPGGARSKVWPTRAHARKVLMLAGCVQPAMMPNVNSATARVLDAAGIQTLVAPEAGCCGALRTHLGDHEGGLADMRRNIDAWWPQIEAGAEAIVTSATGCGSMLLDYGRLLAHDPAYADKARRVSALARDIGEILLQEDLGQLDIDRGVGPVAVQTPCSLQHGMKLPNLIGDILARAGFELAATRDSHLCCGSAGTYSVLQPAMARRLRDDKLRALTADTPAVIASGNVGCQLHLAGAAPVPVVHWIELLDPR